MDNNLAVKLLQGWKTIPQMQEDIELFLELIVSLLEKEEVDILPEYNFLEKQLDKWISVDECKPYEIIKGPTCRWDVFAKVRENRMDRVVFRYWAEEYKEPLYDTSISRFREEEEKPAIHYSVVPEIYEGLLVLAEGMFKLFPQLKERCEPLLKAADAHS